MQWTRWSHIVDLTIDQLCTLSIWEKIDIPCFGLYAVSLYPVVVTSVTPRPYSSLVFAGDTIIKGASLNATGKPTAALEAKYQLYQLVARLVFQVYLLHITMSPLEYFV